MIEKLEQTVRAFALTALAFGSTGCVNREDRPLPADIVFKNLRDNVDKRFPAFTPQQRDIYLKIIADLETTTPKDTSLTLRDAESISDSIANTFMIDDFRPAGTPSQRRSRAIY